MNENTILITVDALRKDHLAQYGYERDTMPVLDLLLDDGRKIERPYSNGAYTKASVPSILTSKINGINEVENGRTIASELSKEGVSTLGIHSNTWLSHDFQEFNGFDDFVDFTDDDSVWLGENESSQAGKLVQLLERKFGEKVSEYESLTTLIRKIVPSSLRHSATPYVNAEITTNHVINWIDGQDSSFFVWVHYMDPHRPLGVSSQKFSDEKIPDQEIHSLMSKAGANPEQVTDDELNKIIDLYDSDIRYMSDHIERLFNYLISEDKYDDTNIILTSDHGEEFKEHGMFFHRNKPYEELINVPLFVKMSKGAGDVDIPQLIDLPPTILDLHGLNIPEEFEGESLLTDVQRDVAISNGYIGEKDYVAVVDGEYKLIQSLQDSTDAELYNLTADREESSPISDDERRQYLEGYVPDPRSSKINAPDTDDIDDSTEERLADLGYL